MQKKSKDILYSKRKAPLIALLMTVGIARIVPIPGIYAVHAVGSVVSAALSVQTALPNAEIISEKNAIEVFYNHNRIASHRRLYSRKGQYSTITEHMPSSHQQYLEWNGDHFRQWAKRIDSSTYQTVDAILTSKLVEQQSYRSCMGLLKLADKYSVDRLEAACRKALTFTATPSYKSIKNILDTGSDRTEPADKAAVTDNHTNSEKAATHLHGVRITTGGKEP